MSPARETLPWVSYKRQAICPRSAGGDQPGVPHPCDRAGLLREPLWKEAARRAEAAQLDQLTIRQRLAHELDERKARIPQILDALVTKAEKGDVPAARELRGWFDQGLGRPEAASLDTGDVDRPYADMTPEERARLRAGVIRRISEAEAALEDGEQAKP
jgi:hypothetical protein